jgi:hypothetical protein
VPRVMQIRDPRENQRARGMSGACRTRGLACENKKHTSFIHLGYAE